MVLICYKLKHYYINSSLLVSEGLNYWVYSITNFILFYLQYVGIAKIKEEYCVVWT